MPGATKALPLEKQTLQWTDGDGKQLEIPAIDKRWCEELDMGNYSAMKSTYGVVVDTWMQHATRFNDALEFLLRADYHVFWSHVIFDEELNGSVDPTASLLAALENFLRLCPRYTDAETMNLMLTDTEESEMQELGREIYQNVLLLVFRLATQKESKDKFMSKSFYCEMIYEKEVLTISRLMDVCSIYGADNDALLRKLLDFLFKAQPRLFKDLKNNMELIKELLDRCEETLTRSCSSGFKLGTRNQPDAKTLSVVLSTIVYAVDVVQSLRCLLLCAPFVGPVICDIGLTYRLAQFSDVIFKVAMKGLEDHLTLFSGKYYALRGRLGYFQKMIIELIRSLISQNYIIPLVEKKKVFGGTARTDEERLSDLADCFLAMCQNQTFICLYDSRHPVEDDVNKLKQIGLDLPRDVEREIFRELDKAKVEAGLEAKIRIYKSCPKLDNPIEDLPPSKRSIVQNIKATLFPKLSNSFLRVLCIHFQWDEEHAIDGLLTNSLPRDLELYRLIAEREEELQDRILQLKGRKQQTTAPAPEKEIASADNSLDPEPARETADQQNGSLDSTFDEEATVLKKIEEGKKHGARNWSDKDRSEIKALKDFYAKFDTETPDEEELRQYEDEYDDTYDAAPAAADGRNRKVRPPSGPGGFNQVGFTEEQSSEEEEEEKEEGPGPSTGRGRGRGGFARGGRGGAADYTGGRGRQLKEKRSVHHRKDRAQTKYSKGMF